MKYTNDTPAAYIKNGEAAKKQLEKFLKIVNEVMYEVGYTDQKPLLSNLNGLLFYCRQIIR